MSATDNSALIRIAGRLEAPLHALGMLCGWLAAAVAAITFAVVVLRYGAGRASIPLQELVLHLNAAMFLLGGAYALARDRHVRVDILHQRWSPRGRALAELVGIAVFLLPFCVFLFWISLDYVAAAWRLREGSRETGGLPGLFLVKTLIPLAAALLAVAGIASALRSVARLGATR